MRDVQLLWFKRDLRVRDHRPLLDASRRGPVLPVYIYEPELLASPEMGAHHLRFVATSLRELESRLAALGSPLVVRLGDPVAVFDALARELAEHDARIARVWSHEETGNHLTYMRDLRVKRWADARGVEWTEHRQTGVVRRLATRDGWSKRWNQFMATDTAATPERLDAAPALHSIGVRSPDALGVLADLDPPVARPDADVQPGGESEAWRVLEDFLHRRGERYRWAMSSPVTAWEGCSRLSPHLAWGTISVKCAYHALKARRAALKAAKADGEDIGTGWLRSLSSFRSRLSWHCHFMQKLEDEPRLEFENLSRAYDGMREGALDAATFRARYEAWCTGHTGYPMVDACMRALQHTGWLNFRMRAMMVSFASYHLWLHWRPTGLHLARLFLDYEPGIHWSQTQMQSGTTGINTPRIYSPAKQVKDHDPSGEFVKRWVPELEAVPNKYIAEPHTLPPLEQRRLGVRIGRDYPAPIVDHKTRYKEARDAIYTWRRRPEARAEAERIVAKHGSRKRSRR